MLGQLPSNRGSLYLPGITLLPLPYEALKSLSMDHPYPKLVFLFASLLVLGVAAAGAQVASSYYVSGTNGNDSWSGTLAAPNSRNTDGPFKTLTRAQSAMQASTIKRVTIR